MKALVLGATGATGKDLVQKLIQDPEVEEVHTFVRRMPSWEHKKIKNHVVDFDQPEQWQHLVQGDVAFSCLGTTLRDAGSKEAQWKIDYDYQYRFAQAAKENGVQDFILVSSYGAHPESKIFYSRMKGELEEAVKALHFDKLTIFNPGMLLREGSKRPLEILGSALLKVANSIGLLKQQKPLPTEILAQAMLNAAKIKTNGFSSIQLGAIFGFARKGHL